MRSIGALVAGSAFVVIVMLVFQLAYVFIAVGYNTLAADFPALKEITPVFRYLVGVPVLLGTLFAGGYIAASIGKTRASRAVWLHGFGVGLLTVGTMMYSALEYAGLTITGIVVMLLAVGASSAGGYYWLRGKAD